MIDILRDPIWQFIGAFLALIAIGMSIYLFILQKNKKALSYRIITETALLTVNEEIKGKLKIVYENVPVQDVHLLVMKIENSGNVPITSSDFEEPLTFSFGETTQILSAETTDVVPRTLKPIISIKDSNKIILEPTLLNGKDNFVVKLLLAQYNKYILPEARIIGVGEIRKSVDISRQVTIFAGVIGGIALNGFSIILINIVKGESPDISGTFEITLIPMILAIIVSLMAKYSKDIFSRRANEKKK